MCQKAGLKPDAGQPDPKAVTEWWFLAGWLLSVAILAGVAVRFARRYDRLAEALRNPEAIAQRIAAELEQHHPDADIEVEIAVDDSLPANLRHGIPEPLHGRARRPGGGVAIALALVVVGVALSLGFWMSS